VPSHGDQASAVALISRGRSSVTLQVRRCPSRIEPRWTLRFLGLGHGERVPWPGGNECGQFAELPLSALR